MGRETPRKLELSSASAERQEGRCPMGTKRQNSARLFALIVILSTPLTLFAGSNNISFVRGDCNDDATFNLADAIFALSVSFPGAGAPPTPNCDKACDANDDGLRDIADAITMLGSLFGGEPPLPAPNPTCGVDPTPDTLTCNQSSACVITPSVGIFVSHSIGTAGANGSAQAPVDTLVEGIALSLAAGSVTVGSDLALVRSGQGPEFISIDLHAGGFTFAAVVNVTVPGLGLAEDVAHEVKTDCNR